MPGHRLEVWALKMSKSFGSKHGLSLGMKFMEGLRLAFRVSGFGLLGSRGSWASVSSGLEYVARIDRRF